MSIGYCTSAIRIWVVVTLCAAAALAARVQAQTVRVDDPRTEYLADPLGIDARTPRLTWKLLATERGTVQSAYQIRVAEQPTALERRPLWDSGKVLSDASTHRQYAGPALRSGHRYYWQVRV